MSLLVLGETPCGESVETNNGENNMIPKMKMSDLMFEYFQHALVVQQQNNRIGQLPPTIEIDEDGVCLDMSWDEVHELFQMFDRMPNWIDHHEKALERIKAKNAA